MKAIIHGLKSTVVSLVVLGAGSAALANNELWIGVSGVSITTNWSDNANWSNLTGGGTPGYTNNDLIFGNTGAVGTDNTINSVADTSGLSLSMTFTNQTSQFHTVLIPTGVTLVNSNALNVGVSPAIDANITKVNITGGGTLLQRGSITVRNNSVNQGGNFSLATLDLSGLSTFILSNTAASINVGGTGSEARAGGAMVLAGGSNNVTVGTLNFVTTTGNVGNNAANSFQFGAGTNNLNVGNFNIVAGKVQAGAVGIQGAGGLRIRGLNGNTDDTSRATITICNRTATGTGNMNGTADFNGHPVNIKAGTIVVGQAGSNPTTPTFTGTANLRFDSGIVDALTINMAANTVANAATIGNLIVGSGASLVVSNLSLVNQTAGLGTGNLHIGGSVNCSGNIFKTTLTGVGSITNVNGTLTMAAGKTVGSSAIPIDNLYLTTATLNLSVVANSSNIVVNTLTLLDNASTANFAALPSIGGFPVQFPIISYVTYAGGGSINLGTLPAGYSGYLSNDLANTVWLVITNGPFVAKLDQWGGGINNLWDTSTMNWTNAGIAVSYNDGDFVVFDDAAASSSVNLTGARLPASLLVSNNVLNYAFQGVGSIGGPIALLKDGSASLTLTETGSDNFSGGINVLNGSLILDNAGSAISGGLNVSSTAIVQISNDSGNGVLPAGAVGVDGTLLFRRTNDLSVGSVIAGAGSLVKAQSAKLTLTATNTYTGATIVNNGTLALTGTASIAASAQVAVTSAALDLTGASGSTTLSTLNLTNANLSLAMPNLNLPLNVAALNLGGSGNTINLSSLPTVANYPVTITIIQSASPIVGFNATLGTLPAGSPPFSGSVALSGDSLSVRLTLTAGPVGIRPNMFWSGAELPNLNTNWTDNLNWQLPGAPTPVDNAIFNNTATVAASVLSTPGGGSGAFDPANVNNIVDANFTVSSLAYTNIAEYHNTFINSGKTLTLTNVLTVGAFNAGDSATHQGFVTIVGAHATLSVNNTNANLQVWLGSGGGGVGGGGVTGSQSTLDLSALDDFTATVSRVALGASVGNAVNRPSGILYLAKTNTIIARFQTANVHAGTTTAGAALTVGDANQNAGSASTLYLGNANTISADTIGIGRQKAVAHFQFNPTYANVAPYPTLTLQGFSSSHVSDFTVADGAGNTGTTAFSADTDLSGGIVNASIDTMNVGRASSGGTGTATTTGTFTFDAGMITANTLNIGLQTAATAKAGVGTFNVNTNSTIGDNAHLTVTGNLNLGTTVGGGGAASTAGTLNINNASVQAGNIVAGVGSSSTINLGGGSLVVSGKAGTPAAPITTVNLGGGTLQLTADGFAGVATFVATTINGNAPTTLNIGAIINVSSATTIPLISYSGTDPFSALTLGTAPAGYVVTLVDNTGNSTIDLQIVPPPVLSIRIDGSQLVISGVNGTTNGTYSVMTSTNAAQSLSNWSVLTSGSFDSNGNFSITTSIGANPQRYYILRMP